MSLLWEDTGLLQLERLHLPQEAAAIYWAGLTSPHGVWSQRPQNYHSVDATKETYLLQAVAGEMLQYIFCCC